MPAGDFSATVLQDITLKAEEVWDNPQMAAAYKANTVTATALKQNSRARWAVDPNKDNTVVISWIDPCGAVAEDCESNCDITEAELFTDSKEYTPTLCKKSGFSVNAEKMRTNQYSVEEQSAIGLATSIKALDDWWNAQAVLKLKSFAGINVSADPYTYAAGTTTVPAANWNLDMVPEVMLDLMLNKMPDAYLINNGNLWVEYKKAMLNAGNADGAGAQARAAAFNMLFDFYGFTAAGITEDLFAVSPGATAFVTTNRNPMAPTLLGGTIQQTRYQVPSSIPGIKYDAYYALKCVTNQSTGKENIVHSWRLETNGDVFLNPEGCLVTINSVDYHPTGVLSYSKGA